MSNVCDANIRINSAWIRRGARPGRHPSILRNTSAAARALLPLPIDAVAQGLIEHRLALAALAFGDPEQDATPCQPVLRPRSMPKGHRGRPLKRRAPGAPALQR